MRTVRHHLLAAAGLTLATLALTACNDGTGTTDEGAAKPTASATASTTDKPSTEKPATENPAATPASDTTKSPSQKASSQKPSTAAPSADDDPAAYAFCNGSNTTVTAQPVSRPLNHMLLTVKNTGSKPCNLTYYPVLRFDEMQWAPRPIEASHPQAVVTLNPGESGYAGVLLSAADGSGDGGTTGKKLTVMFQAGTPNSDGGASATPTLPAKGVYYDSTLAPTYWQTTADDALSY
ncbi:DUF4232 domain-containing protein [Streptomyces justiciae]|uniref:DUF4232 domain-containing protein n=1 Tax=Streptomyces justiciae TaxID=2780140 RepID=A0ABU3LX90_9ACTN|nr:DUF4232 domain-containing protein [Streptomyces justiciae]MDT7843856.1 DUF4232 domain-containing protein [Streptomyces justiciae]